MKRPDVAKTVPEMLRQAASVYEERNKIYGDNYHKFGHFMQILFPTGVFCESADDWNRLGVLIQIVSKLTRYTENFVKGGNDDSLLDMSVYANMMRELDAERKK